MATITLSELKEILTYDAERGCLIWLVNRTRGRKGCVAGRIGGHGYWQVKLNGKMYLCHRLAWLLVYEKWPDQIDHINGNRSDFRLGNLRECTQAQNMANAKRIASKSLMKGVKAAASGRFGARILINGASVWLGTFDTEEQANDAYFAAAKSAHGDFACRG